MVRPDDPIALRQASILAGALPPLLVAAQRVASTVLQGVHGRRRVGQGDAFWQFRQYRPGDSINRIDWRQSAKGRAVYVRETEWEAAASVWLWRDGSPSMAFTSGGGVPVKRERAEILLLALATLLVDAGERVALLGGDRPMTGHAAPRRLAEGIATDAMVRPHDSLPPLLPLPSHGHLVMIGDLLDPLPKIEEIVRGYASQGVRGHLLQVLDPAEEDLPYDGHVRFSGLEREGDHLIRRVEAVRDAYSGRLRAQKDGLAQIASSVGWTWRAHRTDRPPETALLSLYIAMADMGARPMRWGS